MRRQPHRALAALVAWCTLSVACGGAYQPGRARAGDLARPNAAPVRHLSVDPVGLQAAWLQGDATWYGRPYHGRTTANGEAFDMYAATAAHRELPFNTVVRVTWLDGAVERSVDVRINDRGPFGEGRVIDLSYAAALQLGMVERGVVPVSLRVLEWGDGALYAR